jgi:hypothetical protein
MGLSDKLKDLTKKAQEAAVEHQDQLQQAVETAGVVADRRTGGRYRTQIAKAGQKASAMVDSLAAKDDASGSAPPAGPGQSAPAPGPAGSTPTEGSAEAHE